MASSLYPPVEPDREFRKEVFESEKSQLTSRYSRDGVSSKLGMLFSFLNLCLHYTEKIPFHATIQGWKERDASRYYAIK